MGESHNLQCLEHARRLHEINAKKTYKLEGFENFSDYCQGLVNKNVMRSQRECVRLVQAYSTWVLMAGYTPRQLAKYTTSLLGEVAQAGLVRSGADAEAWLRLIDEKGPVAIREEIHRRRSGN